MLTDISAYLGAAFLISELALAVWRRASVKADVPDRDGGSLRILWIVTTASIVAAAFLSAHGARPLLSAGAAWPWIGVAIFVTGAALRWWSIWHLGRFFTVNVALADDHRVVDNGPYRLIRHPSYAGLIAELAGLGAAFQTLPSLLAVLIFPTIALLYRIRLEEAALQTHLPGIYGAYSARTKKIVPWVY